MSQVDGFLNFCKPIGWTSHDAVQFVRRRLGQKRVGHAGTLDPMAGGVLPICLGRATRFADQVAEGSKLYAADIVLGAATDTCDAEGRVVSVGPIDVTRRALTRALGRFVGDLAQVPPAYSALKVAGQPAYALARRGEAVVLAARPVTVYGLALVGWEPPRLSLVLRCSKGTYVRALARDLGADLGCGAYLDALVRLQVGRFTLARAVAPETFERAVAAGVADRLLEPVDAASAGLPALALGAIEARHFGHGRQIATGGRTAVGLVRAYSADGRLLGLARGAGARWQPVLSLVEDSSAIN